MTDEEKDGEGLTIEGCKIDIIPEKEKAINSEGCPICFNEFGELLLIVFVVFLTLGGSPTLTVSKSHTEADSKSFLSFGLT